MKLLFDQNLSHRLCRLLADVFPQSVQVKDPRLDRTSDEEIWQYARSHGFTIVTLDADFSDLAAVRGSPPKVIWLRCGNQSTSFVERLLRDRGAIISEFGNSDAVTCLELY